MNRTLRILALALLFPSLTFLTAGQKEGSAPDKEKTPALVLGGLDPVSLVQGQQDKGKDSLELAYEGHRYLFASQKNKTVFQSNPQKYAVHDRGLCPVSKARFKRDINGDPAIFSVHQGQIYLFANQDTRQAFEKNPTQFVKPAKREGSGPF